MTPKAGFRGSSQLLHAPAAPPLLGSRMALRVLFPESLCLGSWAQGLNVLRFKAASFYELEFADEKGWYLSLLLIHIQSTHQGSFHPSPFHLESAKEPHISKWGWYQARGLPISFAFIKTTIQQVRKLSSKSKDDLPKATLLVRAGRWQESIP